MLNSQELKQIITGPMTDDNIQQVGIDLNLKTVSKLTTAVYESGFIPLSGKTTLCKRYEMLPALLSKADGQSNFFGWTLAPGAYDVTFEQGCDIPADVTLLIRQRSSLTRNGAIIHSSVFDPGFKTNSIGTVLHVRTPIQIEYNARICQIYGYRNTPVAPENLYNGQFQNDQQRQPDVYDALSYKQDVTTRVMTAVQSHDPSSLYRYVENISTIPGHITIPKIVIHEMSPFPMYIISPVLIPRASLECEFVKIDLQTLYNTQNNSSPVYELDLSDSDNPSYNSVATWYLNSGGMLDIHVDNYVTK